jgi:hypothetical protein
MAIPASQKAIRRIAMHQGMLFGGIVGVLIVVGVVGPALLSLWRPDGFYYLYYIVGFFGLAPLLACVAFFLAGLRTAKKTGRVEMGALAGFWTAITVSLLGLVALILRTAIEFGNPFHHFIYPGMYLNMGLAALYGATAYIIVALLLGTAIGVLGGFIGKAYANDVPPIQSMPPLYMYPPTQSTQPPSTPPQNQG